MAKAKFTDVEKLFARDQLQKCLVSRDRLPYTAEFDHLHAVFCNWQCQIEKHEYWLLLSSAAKAGGLAKERPRAS